MKDFLYQIRIDVTESFAKELRSKKYSSVTSNIVNNLKKKNAILICQYDAFKGFLYECEINNQQDTPLYKWTKDTVNNKSKEEKYKKSFTIYVKEEQLYKKSIADSIFKYLQEINSQQILNLRIIDSNPANNPQPPKKYY